MAALSYNLNISIGIKWLFNHDQYKHDIIVISKLSLKKYNYVSSLYFLVCTPSPFKGKTSNNYCVMFDFKIENKKTEKKQHQQKISVYIKNDKNCVSNATFSNL